MDVIVDNDKNFYFELRREILEIAKLNTELKEVKEITQNSGGGVMKIVHKNFK